MKKYLFLALLGMAFSLTVSAQKPVENAKFHIGDNMEWANPQFDDSSWQTISMLENWDNQGIENNQNFGWYRAHIVIPKSLLNAADQKESVVFDLPKADDAGEVYLNGKLIGKNGRFPTDEGGYRSNWNAVCSYPVSVDDKAIHWDGDNVIAYRVYNNGEPGGLFERGISVRVPNRTDGLVFTFTETTDKKGNPLCNLTIANTYPLTQKGTLTISLSNPETETVLSNTTKKISLSEGKSTAIPVKYDRSAMNSIVATYTDAKSGLEVAKSYIPKYILTPDAPDAPLFNNAPVYGVRPGSPIIYRFPVSGKRPLKITSGDLPAGLELEAENGVLTGALDRRGDYTFTVTAENAFGKDEQTFTIKVGDVIGLTPPMGWNSWNCWGLSVSQERVMSSAQALLDKGLADYGYCYVNVDDAWEAAERNADGTIATNEKFPDMKGLGDWLHAHGLKFGIYSSPGDYTCGGYLGSLDHERQDAETFNSWGVDYLKYDWCGYSRTFDKESSKTVAAYIRPYLLMQQCLRDQPRDIFYSLCQYGMAKVWEWGRFVDANSWRTTGDITDTWASMYNIGFQRQVEVQPYGGPGHWNDPDMLIVGKVGWSSNLRDSRLTPDEQYTHISLWTLLASNMLIGCDIAQMDDFTVKLLCNREVNFVNQDVLGIQASRDVRDGAIQIWRRPLADGSYAVGIFNTGSENLRVDFSRYFKELGIPSLKSARDLWRQQDLNPSETTYFIPTHGVKYLKVTY